MVVLTREKIQRMSRNTGSVIGGGGGSGSGGGSSEHAASADYATEAGHAAEADEATHATAAANLDSDSSDWNKILRKDIADTAAEVITFAKGIVSTLASKFKAGIKIGASDQYQIDANGDATLRDISGRVISGTGNITSNGAMQAYGNITSTNGNMQAVQMLSNVFKTLGYSDAWANMIGQGFGVKVDNDGIASLQVDNLLVLGQMIVNSLNIREVTFIGGAYYLSPAASEVAKVQPLYTTISYKPDTKYWTPDGSGDVVGYRLLWKADNGTIGTMNYWHQGDMVYCHTFNITQPGHYTNFQNQNYKRLVCRVGTVTIEDQDYHYADVADITECYLFDSNDNPILNVDGGTLFVGITSNNTTPKSGDNVVACGSQADTTRQGVILISTEGEAAIGIYDGIKDYRALSNYEIHYFSRTAVRMNAQKLTWKTTGGNETQASFMARADDVFLGIGNCGIDITNQSITAKGGKFKMQDQNGNDTFVLDTNGDLVSEGSASFKGTIKSPNFYHSVCYYMQGNSYIDENEDSWGYCISTTYTVGSDTYDLTQWGIQLYHYYSLSQIIQMTGGVISSWVNCFKKTSYKADIIMMTPKTTNWNETDTDMKTVLLPDPQDFFGKTVDVSAFSYSGDTTVNVGCVKTNSITTGLLYCDSNGRLALSASTGDIANTTTINTSRQYIFQSVKAYYGGSYKYYWKKISI